MMIKFVDLICLLIAAYVLIITMNIIISQSVKVIQLNNLIHLVCSSICRTCVATKDTCLTCYSE